MHYKNFNIHHLEMINIVVAIKLLGNFWRDKKIKIYCDNLPVVEVLTTNRARDQMFFILPHSVTKFDVTRPLSKGDIFFSAIGQNGPKLFKIGRK